MIRSAVSAATRSRAGPARYLDRRAACGDDRRRRGRSVRIDHAGLGRRADTDTIADFTHASDRIALSNAGFGLGLAGASATPQALPASLFSPQSNGSFTTTAQRFAYNSTSGALSYDADGSGAGASRLIATLTTHPTLATTDLFFVA